MAGNTELFEAKSMEDHRPRRQSLKTQRPKWKEKLWSNCLERVRADRARLLWKIRSAGKPDLNQKEIAESAFRDIVCDELKRIKQSSLSDCLEISASDADDSLWNYDGPHIASESTLSDGEELMIEMEKALYEDLKAEAIRRAELEYIDQTEEEEDDYLAQAVFEQMQLNDDLVGKDDRIWCPICKRGELRENTYLIYCTSCGLQLDIQSDKVTLDFLRVRLAEAHVEHLDRGCKAKPKFCVETKFNMTALYIKCQACGTFEIVL
ncbi:hypothetical protein AAC387_Pa01g4358 [Persea americana]